jgi:glycine cleavage system H protein
MKKKAPKKGSAESASAQNRCIWMTAGVISFKLCPLSYDCEHCDFDQVMRSQVKSKKTKSKVKGRRLAAPKPSDALPRSKAESKEPLFFTFTAGDIDRELYLHPSHLWIRQLEEDKWMLGIDKLLAYVMPPPVRVQLCRSDNHLARDRSLGKIVAKTGSILLTVPLSGRVVQTNPRLGQRPELVQEDPYGEGWLAMMDSLQDQSELQNFYTGKAGRRFLEEEAQHLNFLLRHRGIEVNQIGETLPDGGVNVRYLHQVLPGQLCSRLASELIVTGKQGW